MTRELKDIEIATLGLRRILGPLVADAVRLEVTQVSEDTKLKEGRSVISMNISSPRIGSWHLKFELIAGDTPSQPTMVGCWKRKGSSFQLDPKRCNNKSFIKVKDFQKANTPFM